MLNEFISDCLHFLPFPYKVWKFLLEFISYCRRLLKFSTIVKTSQINKNLLYLNIVLYNYKPVDPTDSCLLFVHKRFFSAEAHANS